MATKNDSTDPAAWPFTYITRQRWRSLSPGMQLQAEAAAMQMI